MRGRVRETDTGNPLAKTSAFRYSADMDWKALIAELQEYLSQPQIAAIVGCGQSTLSDLASGASKEPRYSLGESLKALLTRCRAGEFQPRREAA
jgi:predicted XRE-type DNA-binding protein